MTDSVAHPAPHRQLAFLAPIAAVTLIIVATVILMIPVVMNDIFFHSALYNEGWNIYHAMRVAHGEPLYDANLSRPVNYTYLSFYITGWLGLLTGAPLGVARTLSFLAFIATVLGCGTCVRAVGGSLIAAALASVLFTGFCAIATGEWIGVADPQFLAQALSMAGLALHLKATTRPVRVIAAPLCLVLAVFTKQQEIAVPAAILVDVFVNHRKDLPAWLAVMAGLTLVFLAVGFLAGVTFLERIIVARRYSLYYGIGTTWRFVELVQLPLAIGVIWLLSACPPRFRTLFWALGLTTFLSMIGFAGGFGVGRNIVLDFLMWISITAGLGATAFRTTLHRGTAVCAVLSIAAGFEIELKAFLAVGRERQVWSQLVQQERDFRAGIAFVAGRPGEAICEDMLLCYFAGKPLIVDPFNSEEMVALGRLSPSVLIDPVIQGRIGTIQLDNRIQTEHGSGHIVSGQGFHGLTEDFQQAVADHYRLDHVSSSGAFYVPNR